MRNIAIWLTGCLLGLALLGGAALAQNDRPLLILAATQYQLTTGQTVTVFLLEREGQLCTAISSGGLHCEPLQNTTYGRQIGKP